MSVHARDSAANRQGGDETAGHGNGRSSASNEGSLLHHILAQPVHDGSTASSAELEADASATPRMMEVLEVRLRESQQENEFLRYVASILDAK